MDFDPGKAAAHPLVAGLLGALVGLKFAPGTTWPERTFNVVCGAACAAYVAPAIGEAFNLLTAPKQAALSFLMGMFGMSIAAAIVQGIRDLQLAQIISDWIPRRGGK